MVRDRLLEFFVFFFFFSSRRRHTRLQGDWSSDVCSSDLYVRCLYERFDLVFAPSRVMCEYLEDLGVQRVSHQPLGVDAEVFHPRRRTLALRPLLGLPAQARVLIFAGRFAGEKNLPVLLQAFARLGA